MKNNACACVCGLTFIVGLHFALNYNNTYLFFEEMLDCLGYTMLY